MQELKQEDYALEIVEDLGIIPVTKTEKRRCAVFLCDCGEQFISQTRYVKSGKRWACPTCSRRTSQLTHGLTKHPIYKSHNDMKRRCYNPKSEKYKSYGARGINICDEWKNSFETFYVWALAHGWKEGLTIDRKDVNGDYTPANCRWLDKRSQSHGKRKLDKNTSGYIGVRHNDYGKWKAQGQTWDKKRKHLGTYNTALEAAKARDAYYVVNGFVEMTLNNVPLYNTI